MIDSVLLVDGDGVGSLVITSPGAVGDNVGGFVAAGSDGDNVGGFVAVSGACVGSIVLFVLGGAVGIMLGGAVGLPLVGMSVTGVSVFIRQAGGKICKSFKAKPKAPVYV